MTTMDEDVDDLMSPKLGSSGLPVRRCLFGRPDADTTRHDLERAWTQLLHRSTVVWNFDFERQRPVAGQIVWTHDGRVWVGKIAAPDSESHFESVALSVTSTHSAARRDHTPSRRHRADHTTGVMTSSRLTRRRRRQSRVTGCYIRRC